jgi:ankyrin repeat protein
MKSRKRKSAKNRKSRKFSKKKIAGADNDCPICLRNINNREVYITSCCKKQFHYECLKNWYATKIKKILARKDEDEDEEEAPTCPMCRKALEYIKLNKDELPLNNDQIQNLFFDAIDNNITSIVQNMIDFGAEIEATDRWEETPLHRASAGGHKDVVELLLGAGANIEATDKNEMTPLHLASWFGHSEVVEKLLGAGANIEAPEEDGKTPLHLASQQGHTEVVLILLKSGADIEAKDKNGETPLHIANAKEHTAVVKILKNYKQSTSASGKKKRKKKPTKKKRRH